ncbi:Leucine-rich repeat-containing protein 37A2 [Heterocephalus glaber]|uniref:Leucine-rich repeat-containing protein 37A2 n=1 Tax=Heterocephalus glaber TaxID=10181 RepID=G5AM58_HETGA|nr:Leucine-rich repeat-containing protein 37A2 [Heterocephalus glaber]
MEISSTHQEAPAHPLSSLVEAELSATKTKPAQPSESSRTEEPSEIQLKAPDQPSDLENEELETSPTQLKQPAQFSDYDPPEVELSPAQPMMLPQLPSEPPNESEAHPPPHSETTAPTPAQGQAQQPSVAFRPLDLEATIIPERTTDGEFSTALKKATALPPKHHEVTLPPPDWVQTQHSKLNSALILISTDDHTNKMHWEYTSTGTEPPPPGTSVPLLSSPGDEFKTQLNQQLHILIPNKEVRRLISYIIRTLKMDCSEPCMQLACAKLISRTGLLMKLLSGQQEEKVGQAQWDTEQWKSETYINKSTGASSNQKAQGKPRNHTQEVPGHGYNNIILEISVSAITIAMLLIIIFCLIEICSHRTASGKDKEGSSSSIFRWRRKYSAEQDSQEGFSWFWWLLCLRDMSRPLSITRQQSMVQKLHNKDSSDKDQMVTNDLGEASETPSEAEESTKAGE